MATIRPGLAPAASPRAGRDYGGEQLADDLLELCEFPHPGPAPLVLAVSGGQDSLALMVLAARAGLPARAVHVDHGLREGSDLEARVVADAAAALGLGFDAVSVQVEAGPDLEARARRARYEALPYGVLTGHTMDDQAETVLLNLIRGAGLDGLSGMRSGAGGPARRPLLRLRRSDTAALCAAVGLVAVHDPSNDDPRFRRNRVRAELVPLLCEVADRDVVPVLARQAALVADEAALLDEMAAHLEATDVQALRSAPPALARRAVRRWLTAPGSWADAESHPPSSAEVARVLAVAGGSVRACEIAGGRRVERRQGRLRVIPVDPGASDFEAPGDFGTGGDFGTVGTPGRPESRLARG